MSNFGFTDLRLVHPYEPSFREARSAVGAAAVLASAREYGSVAEAVADCTLVVGTTSSARRELQHPLRRLDAGAKIIHKKIAQGQRRSPRRAAILFGSEKRGLANDDLSHCHWLMRIPTREEHGSMNLGQAVAICLYELARSGKPAKAVEKIKAASAGDLERVTALMVEALRASGYLGSRPVVSAEEKTRRMVRRLNFSEGDAEFWMGVLRKMLWKMGGSGDRRDRT